MRIGCRSRFRWTCQALIALTAGQLAVALAAAQVNSGQQQPRFEASVARVRVDVIVTDGDGRFVNDVRADEFSLFEDGRQQEILDVQLVDLLDGILLDLAQPAAAAAREAVAAPSRFEARASSPGSAESPSDFAAMVFVIDGMSLGFRANSRFARRWASTLRDIESVNIPHAVYLLDFFGYAHELAALTQDTGALRSAAEKIRGKAFLGGSSVDPIYASIVGGMHFGWGPRATNDPILRRLTLLTALCNVLAERPGRKALVWVSAELRSSDRIDGADVRRRAADSTRSRGAQQAFERAANSAGVSVYGVDPTLVTQLFSMGGASSRTGPVDTIRRNPFAFGVMPVWRNALVEVARATGGQTFLRWPDIPKVLRLIEHDMSRFYMLSYAPPAPPEDGEYHEIRVMVAGARYQVRARDGYFDLSDEQRRQRAASGNALLAKPGPLVERRR